ncbi:DUF7940 domain-containing protein [Halomonas sp. hl-4]|uniref:DUF7940 domain-containing protein n=1 Tax=Halomonas sp. hl-4 TaxID=1761789 RepID=UPI000BB810C5|nr:hypothetical protein [Halomonas sp. hl-4]SNY95556.1 hypothetical protein SAMN04488142_0057 [Halomonas sp. hl-4]
MKLIPNSRQASKMWSIRLAALAAALAAAETTLPLWSDIIPDGAFAALSSGIAVAAAVARVIKQANIDE